MLSVAESALPALSIACFTAATAIAGGKLYMAGACKVVGCAKQLLGQNDAREWHQASSVYLTSVKKDAPRDFVYTAGLLALGMGAIYAKNVVVELNEEPSLSESASKYYDNFIDSLSSWIFSENDSTGYERLRDHVVIPTVAKVYEYIEPILLGGGVAGLLYIEKGMRVSNTIVPNIGVEQVSHQVSHIDQARTALKE